MERNEALAQLTEIEHVRTTTRTALHSFWYPLVVFGAITLASALVCELAPAWGVGVYWTVAAIGGFAAVARYYHRRELRLGARASAGPYVATGIAIMVSAWILGAVGGILESTTLELVGPPLAVSAGYLVFAWLAKSRALAGLALGLASVSAAIGFADVGHACAFSALAFGGACVAGGLLFRRADRYAE